MTSRIEKVGGGGWLGVPAFAGVVAAAASSQGMPRCLFRSVCTGVCRWCTAGRAVMLYSILEVVGRWWRRGFGGFGW